MNTRNFPEHPVISQILRTGYPDSIHGKCVICQDCDQEVYEDEELYEWEEYDSKTGKTKVLYICPDCFDARLDDLSRNEKAELIGVKHMTVQIYLEEGKGCL